MTEYKVDKHKWGDDDPEVVAYTRRRIRELQGERPYVDTIKAHPYIERYFKREKGADTDVKNPL